MKKFSTLAAILTVVAIAWLPACRPSAEIEQPDFSYPETRTVDHTDDYFGTQVADPYRWLEDTDSDETAAWVKAQNEVTFGYLERIPFREKLRRRITELYNYPKFSSPFRVGEHYFFSKNDGLQNQSVIYVQKGLEGDPEVFLDPNALSPDGTLRVFFNGVSRDDRFVSLSRSEAGSDWQEIRIMEVATRRELEDRVRWVKFSGAAWSGNGFFYSGYDAPEEGEELKQQNRFQKVFYHKLGDPQERDTLVWEDRDHPLRYVSADVTEDGGYLLLSVSEGTSGNQLHVADLGGSRIDFKPLITGFEGDSYAIDNVGGRLLVQTNLGAPNGRVVLIDPASPSPDGWTDVIPENKDVLSGANSAGGFLFCNYLQDAHTRIFQHDMEGRRVREIKLPTLGTAGGFGGKKEDKILFYSFTSFTYPPAIYKYNVETGISEVFRKTEVPFNPQDYEAEQVFFSSKDGTRVPMFLVYRKGLEKSGRNPALLSGYGGFNISEVPYFSSTRIALLEQGFVFAQACLRGGGEYGKKWHEAGMLLNKQNVFDDFIAAAEYLIAEKYTNRDRLAVSGASNGGLLVGAAMTQRPELFKVALPAVGVMDMLRYHKFTVGWGWAVEYGSSDEEEHFKSLYAYSPLHNIRKGVSYPATLVTTADHDDRVLPAHSFKFAATLQDRHLGSNPVLIRIETRSGHGSSSTSKMIEELTDEYTFLFFNLGVRFD